MQISLNTLILFYKQRRNCQPIQIFWGMFALLFNYELPLSNLLHNTYCHLLPTTQVKVQHVE